jgi:saccharopine dehydrogenase (NAD+, L-lysine forming)
MNETKGGGPFPEILKHDIFVNCIYLSTKIPPFLTKEMVCESPRPLSVIVDVSCDTTNPNNPIPIYNKCTTFDDPTVLVACAPAAPIDVAAIDQLPTLLPREASEAFCKDLMPTLLSLKDRANSSVWQRAEKLFREKMADAMSA